MTVLGVVSVNVARPQVLLPWPSGDIISSIDKRPVDAATLLLGRLNLQGDEQSDTRPTPHGGQVHGGPDQAVYAFPVEHLPRISELRGRPAGPGFIGENVTVEGALEDDVRIGDVWAWGDARLQVTAPRGPCYKLGIRLGRQAMRTVVRAEGLVGWYLRVLVEGEVPVAGPIEVVEQHPAGITVGTVHRALQDRATTYPDLAGLDVMSAVVRGALRRRDRDLTGGVPEVDG